MNTLSPTTRGTEVGSLIRSVRERLSLSEEIARKFILASILEPIADKPGCTTRFIDLKDTKRLEFFLTAGVNSGFAIKRLVDHLQVQKNAGRVTLEGAFAFLTEAVVMSKFNRGGGKINHGILEPIIPLIAAQVFYFEECIADPLRVFARARELTMLTTPDDVADLVEAKEIANKIAGVQCKYPVRRHDVSTVFEYYEREVEVEVAEGKLTGILHNRQFTDGFADIKMMLRVMMASRASRLLEKVEEAYEVVRTHHHEKIGVGLAADHSAVALYLYIALVEHRQSIE